MGLAIVAIPEEQDRVWKFSSEKVPHLTLLFLGDEASADTQQIVQFVEHATQLSEHGPFYLDVESRGELGKDNADVLFFSKRSWNLKWIKQFRGQLLQNQAVRTAYDSAEQFGAPQEWTPHLTMGYPETPAKPQDGDNDYPFYSVCFDRIAVWLGDFDGPEFKLEWPDRPEELDGPLAVAWADEQKKALTHVGVKGMKWGVRKSNGTSGQSRSVGTKVKKEARDFNRSTGRHNPIKKAEKKLARKETRKAAVKKIKQDLSDSKYKISANSGKNVYKFVDQAGKNTKSKDLPKINAKYEGAAKTSNTVHLLSLSKVPVQKQYREEVRKAYEKNLNDVVSNSPTSKSGKLKYELRDPLLGGKQSPTRWRVKTVKIEHADNSDEFDIVLVFDEDGFIVDFKHEPIKEQEMAQTALKGADFVDSLVHGVAEEGEAFILEHYGVKGMRWGSRKAAPSAVPTVATSRVPQGSKRKTKIDTEGGQNHPAHTDAVKVAQAQAKLKKSGPKALSNQELRDVANRVQLEEQVKGLMTRRGRKFAQRQLEVVGTQTVQRGIAKGIAKGAAKKGGKAALLFA